MPTWVEVQSSCHQVSELILGFLKENNSNLKGRILNKLGKLKQLFSLTGLREFNWKCLKLVIEHFLFLKIF